ncbi:MAG: hypothetical protein CMC94_02035 [Flavobacteriales bacterium]|nr:hypothetical protein [Flavobacteriales bacterium]
MLYLKIFKYTKMQLLLLCFCTFLSSCTSQSKQQLIVGANQLENYLPLLRNKQIAVVANQTSLINGSHLVDSLLACGVSIVKVFAPEHGFRGESDAGALINDEIDLKTGLPIHSLYGKNKKPSAEALNDIDLIVFDIQDVGARYYTYISTLHYVMEACAENNIELLVLDRPNPNAHYVDGPILDTAYQSFVGMHPIPIVHGLTIGEYAQMINGSFWLKDSIQCNLTVQEMKYYTHNLPYDLPVKPSPNLPNSQSISLYPSLCLFEGTAISVGRGTNLQFQIIGSPLLDSCSYSFSPSSQSGAKYPKHENLKCCGWDLSKYEIDNGINLSYLIECFNQYNSKGIPFFNSFFDKLAGSNVLRVLIEAGWSEAQIKETWQEGLQLYKQQRLNYLIYPE